MSSSSLMDSQSCGWIWWWRDPTLVGGGISVTNLSSEYQLRDILHTRPEESVWPDVVHYIHFYFCIVNILHYAWVRFPIVRHYAELAIQWLIKVFWSCWQIKMILACTVFIFILTEVKLSQTRFSGWKWYLAKFNTIYHNQKTIFHIILNTKKASTVSPDMYDWKLLFYLKILLRILSRVPDH